MGSGGRFGPHWSKAENSSLIYSYIFRICLNGGCCCCNYLRCAIWFGCVCVAREWRFSWFIQHASSSVCFRPRILHVVQRCEQWQQTPTTWHRQSSWRQCNCHSTWRSIAVYRQHSVMYHTDATSASALVIAAWLQSDIQPATQKSVFVVPIHNVVA